MEDVLADARRALAAGQTGAAAKLLKEVVRAVPTNGEAWYWLGQALPEPAQKAECAQRAAALGYLPEQDAASSTGATQTLSLPAEQPAMASLPTAAPEAAENRYASDVAAARRPAGSSLSETAGAATANGQLIPPAVPPDAGYAYVMPTGSGAWTTAVEYAGFGRRLVAFLIDAVIIGVIDGVISAIVSGILGLVLAQQLANNPGGVTSFIAVMGGVVGLVGQWLYFAVFESSRQQATPGKLVMSLNVTDLAGQRISFARASGRYFGKFVSGLLLGIGYLMAAFTERKQALHDLMAGTLIIHRR